MLLQILIYWILKTSQWIHVIYILHMQKLGTFEELYVNSSNTSIIKKRISNSPFGIAYNTPVHSIHVLNSRIFILHIGNHSFWVRQFLLFKELTFGLYLPINLTPQCSMKYTKMECAQRTTGTHTAIQLISNASVTSTVLSISKDLEARFMTIQEMINF